MLVRVRHSGYRWGAAGGGEAKLAAGEAEAARALADILAEQAAGELRRCVLACSHARTCPCAYALNRRAPR